MEFLRNICGWFLENKDSIILTLTSTQFISLITSIVLLIKQYKSTKQNTSSTNTLNANISGLKELTDKVNAIDEKSNSAMTALQEQNKALTEVIELQNLVITKMNLQLEAQLQVWATIKDDNVRNNVNTILTSAKYAESSAIAELQQKIEDLQAKLVNKASELTSDVKNSVEDVKKVVSKKTNVKRA